MAPLSKTTNTIVVQEIGAHLPHDRFVAMMAWSSTNKWLDAFEVPDKRIEGMIRFLITGSGPYKAHASPFGHSHITVYCEAPMAVFAQVVRHRSFASYSVLSLRYTIWKLLSYLPKEGRKSIGKAGAYETVPLTGWRNGLGLTIMRSSYTLSTLAYLWLVKLGWANELARFVAPEGRMTQWFMTMSLRNGLNFLVLRTDQHTMKETRELALQIEAILEKHWPVTLQIWRERGRPQL